MKSENKKIIVFALALLIVAGIIVVVLKGFNVSLSLQAHDTLKFVFDQKFETADVDKICKEVFGEKEYDIKTVEVFTDAVYIISPTITNEERDNLIAKLDNLYENQEDTTEETLVEENTTENETVEDENSTEENGTVGLIQGIDYDFYTDSKVRIRDIVRPYITPSLISAIIIMIYVAIRYRKLNDGKVVVTVFKTIVHMILILLVLLSIIAITRIPFQGTIIPILIFIILCCLVIKFTCYERQLKIIEENK